MDQLERLVRKHAVTREDAFTPYARMRAGLYGELSVRSYGSIIAGAVVLNRLTVEGVNHNVQVFMPPNGKLFKTNHQDTQIDVTHVSWEELAVYLRLT